MNFVKLSMFFYVMPFFCLTGCHAQSPNHDPTEQMPKVELIDPGYSNGMVSTPTITLDTNYTRWADENVSILDSNDGFKWSTTLDDRHFGTIVKSDQHFYAASVKYHFTNGRQSSCDLIFDVLDTKGSLIASSRESNIVGYSVVSLVANDDEAYIMYQHSLSSTDRDLYVAKLDTNANIIWSTRIGKRFGVFGGRLLQVHPNGSLIALSTHYGTSFVEVLDSNTGVIQKSQQLKFPHELIIESFIINQAHHITAIATENYYIESAKFNSVLLFELDTTFKVIRQQHFDTELHNWGQDIVQRPDGHYIFMVNSEFSSQNYEEEFEMHILAVTDPNFQLVDQQAFEIEHDGMNSLFFLHKKDIYLYQRSPKGFNLLVLNPKLQLKKAYTNKEGYRHPEFLTIGVDNKIWVGGSSINTWIVELGL